MTQEKPSVLALNGGSSSIKFALYEAGDPPTRRLHGKVDRVGSPGTTLTFDDPVRTQRDARGIGDLDHRAAADFLIDWLERQIGLGSISAVGHRLVNGGAKYREPQRVTTQLLDALRGISAYAPEHLPFEIALIDLIRERAPGLPQVVCFDPAFHRDMPRVATIVPIPRRFNANGVERYGFHGLSYAFLMEELARVAGAQAAQGRVILAHLGNGSSLAAVHGGTSIDTRMGFTPAAGVPMSTRSGDLDPGLIWYLASINVGALTRAPGTNRGNAPPEPASLAKNQTIEPPHPTTVRRRVSVPPGAHLIRTSGRFVPVGAGAPLAG